MEWRKVPGFENYEISSNGLLRKGDKILKPCTNKKGYLHTTLHLNGKKRPLKIHTIVLLAFIGEKPEGYVARHLDGNKLNNAASNLCWGTYAENYADMRKHGTTPDGENHGANKLTLAQVHEIRAAHASGKRYYGVKQLAQKFGVNTWTISAIARRLMWTASDDVLKSRTQKEGGV